MAHRTLAERMADAARELIDTTDAQGTMDTGVELALTEIDSCDAAGISLVHQAGGGA